MTKKERKIHEYLNKLGLCSYFGKVELDIRNKKTFIGVYLNGPILTSEVLNSLLSIFKPATFDIRPTPVFKIGCSGCLTCVNFENKVGLYECTIPEEVGV